MKVTYDTAAMQASSEKLKAMLAKRVEKMAASIGNRSVRNAESYSKKAKLTGTTFDAEATTSGGGFPIIATVAAFHRSEGAAITYNIAQSGHAAYTIEPVNVSTLKWPSSYPGNRKGNWYAKKVNRKAKAPTLPPNMLQTAVRNAIQYERNRWG
jgi:hypothetical protein